MTTSLLSRFAALSTLAVLLFAAAPLRAAAPADLAPPTIQGKDGLEALAKKLKAAVKAGKLSKDQAMKIWNAAVKKAKAGKKGKTKKTTKKKLGGKKLDAIAKKLKAAVKAGKLTPAQAKAKWAALQGGKKSKS